MHHIVIAPRASTPRRRAAGLIGGACAALMLGALAATVIEPAAAQAQAAAPGKIVFDLTSGNAKQLLAFLEVIDETRQSLIQQGVTPDLVLAFRGPATKLVQSDMSQVKSEDHEAAQKIAAKVKALRNATGIREIEQCGIAVRLAGVKPEHVLEDVKVVENSWVTLAAYQAQGYAYILP